MTRGCLKCDRDLPVPPDATQIPQIVCETTASHRIRMVVVAGQTE